MSSATIPTPEFHETDFDHEFSLSGLEVPELSPIDKKREEFLLLLANCPGFRLQHNGIVSFVLEEKLRLYGADHREERMQVAGELIKETGLVRAEKSSPGISGPDTYVMELQSPVSGPDYPYVTDRVIEAALANRGIDPEIN